MSEASLEVMTIPSDPERFREVRAWLLEVARSAGLAASQAHDAALAVNEICANIHRHAYAGARHGFGVRPVSNPCGTWTRSCADWMRDQGFLRANTP